MYLSKLYLSNFKTWGGTRLFLYHVLIHKGLQMQEDVVSYSHGCVGAGGEAQSKESRAGLCEKLHENTK